MASYDLVYWSVYEANRRNAGLTKSIRYACPKCGQDEWHVYHGVDEQYRSQYNPGEYVEFTCAHCGYSWEEPC